MGINYLGFIDETGVLAHDPNQPFFGIGLLLIEDTSAFYEELNALKTSIISQLALEKQQQNQSAKGTDFEFKFNWINNSNYKFYFELINLYFRYSSFKFCCLVIDKQNPKVDVKSFFPDSWTAYIRFSSLLIQSNIKSEDEKVCVVADYLGKPKAHHLYYEPEIKKIKNVYNATVIESHASLFVQVVDVLIGCVVYEFKENRYQLGGNKVKKAVCDHLKKKLNKTSLSSGFTTSTPSYFSIWEFKPK